MGQNEKVSNGHGFNLVQAIASVLEEDVEDIEEVRSESVSLIPKRLE